MNAGDRVLYIPRTQPVQLELVRIGTVQALSGASAKVLYDDEIYPIWAPQVRLVVVEEDLAGWAQIKLFN